MDYQKDCVHLKACRRLQKISRSKGFKFSRHCDEKCSAYEDIETLISRTPKEKLSSERLFELSEPEMYEAVMQNADVVLLLDDRAY